MSIRQVHSDNRAIAGITARRFAMVRRIFAMLGNDQGSAMVELALTLPPLLLLVTGMLIFGTATNNYIMLDNATSIGINSIAISRGQITDPCSVGSSAVILAAPNLNSTNLTFSYVFNATTYTGTSCSSTSTTTGAAGNLIQGQPITMTVTYPCTLKIFNANIAPTCNLQSQITEIVQ